MASRLFQFRYSYERDLCDIYAKISIGAAGAPTLVNSKGIVSMTRNSAGNYTIVLKDQFYLFMSAGASFLNATAPAAPGMYVVSEQVNSTTSPSLIVQFNAAGSATDPGSGELMLLHIVCRSAST